MTVLARYNCSQLSEFKSFDACMTIGSTERSHNIRDRKTIRWNQIIGLLVAKEGSLEPVAKALRETAQTSAAAEPTQARLAAGEESRAFLGLGFSA